MQFRQRGGVTMSYWLMWTIRRSILFSGVWIIAHAMLILWQAMDPNYITYTEWIAANILKPLHPPVVWVTKNFIPALETYVGNMQPTHEDAPKVLYPLLMGVIGGGLTLVWAMGAMLMRARSPKIVIRDTHERRTRTEVRSKRRR